VGEGTRARQFGESIFPAAACDAGAVGAGPEPTACCRCLRTSIRDIDRRTCGIVSAVYRGMMVDQVFTGFAMLGASVPSFWLGHRALADLSPVVAGVVSGSGYGRAWRFARSAHLVPGGCPPPAGPAQFGADHPLHACLDARRAGRGLRAHGARQGPGRRRRGAQARAAQRAGAHRHRHRPDGGVC
jgi:hypothetical protein